MKKFSVCLLSVYLVLCLVGCGGNEITLNLAYGSRTGTYTGDMLDGIPHGSGKFTTKNPEGVSWTYEGEFKSGHFEGQGKTTWTDGQIEIGTYKNDVIVPMKGDEIKALHSNPQSFENHYVELIGKVFTTPEYGDGFIALQMWADYEKSDKNTIVYIYDQDFSVETDDYVRVVGLASGVFEGENAFGATVSAPVIHAKEYETVSYQDAVMPALHTVNVNKTITQFGYAVTIDKIEFAKKETRVYVNVQNGGMSEFSLYTYGARISQNGTQYEEESNWEADYPEIQTDLLVGNTTSGIIVFPPVEQSSFDIILDGDSDNYREDFSKFIFNIEV
ncbi:MAG: hypothetical protein IKB82_08140 [Clostridia bacterium]|nr:hypothetical protein [Clostridia bacterium]MBR6653235.1 hypothetical protein [Oscillospiraceae bacterium]